MTPTRFSRDLIVLVDHRWCFGEFVWAMGAKDCRGIWAYWWLVRLSLMLVVTTEVVNCCKGGRSSLDTGNVVGLKQKKKRNEGKLLGTTGSCFVSVHLSL